MVVCYHEKNPDPTCQNIDVSTYSDLDCTWGIYTFIFNHSITNQIDQFHMLFMFTVIIVIYFYQCIKIFNSAKNSNKSIEFQVLFIIWTLLKLLQLSYTYMGFQIDQSKQWKLQTKKNSEDFSYTIIKQNYCDSKLFYDMEESQKCYVRYEVNGFLLQINIYLTTVVIQMMTFYWQKQIYPSMFINPCKVLVNIYVPLRIKICHLLFLIIDIIILLYTFAIWIWNDCALDWPTNEPLQFIFPILTLAYFIYTIWNLHHNGERLYWNQKLIAICTTCYLLVRIIYLIMFQFVFGGNQIIDNYQRTPFFSFIQLLINIFEFLQRTFINIIIQYRYLVNKMPQST